MSRVLSSDFLSKPQWELLQEPVLQFSRSADEETQHPVEGIQKMGPYDYNTRARPFNSVRLVFLYKKGQKNEQLMNKINSKIRKRIGYYKGFRSEFRLDSVETDFIPYEEGIDEFQSILRDMSHYSIDSSSLERSIVFVAGEDYKAFSDTEHYYTSKRSLLRSGVPCQYLSRYDGPSGTGVLKQNMDSRDFAYTIWNVVLSAYAKLGGIPWILKESVIKAHSIDAIAGIRFARDKVGGPDSKYVIGAVTVFGSHGLLYGVEAHKFYHSIDSGERFFSKSKGLFVSEDDSKKLAQVIVDRYLDNEHESPNHIIIHRSGPFHEQEINGLKAGLKKAGVEKYAFIEIFRGQNPRVFDITGSTASSVRRGLVLRMSGTSSLICSTGDQKFQFRGMIKTPEHKLGTPLPISANIRLSQDSISDPLLAAQNIFNLTSLHWGCGWTQEVQMPVTLEFAHKIAKLYAHGVNPHNVLRETSWFL